MNTATFSRVILFLSLGVLPSLATAQQVFYNGASVHVQAGAHIYIQGGFTNQGSGQVTSKGTITLTGNWVNNASNAVFTAGDTGLVVLNGTTQTIQGTGSTHFARLSMKNASVKTVSINTRVTDRLMIDSSRVALTNDTLYLSNPAANSLTRSIGYISNGANGAFVRATNTTSAYLFPMGSNVGTVRYRPIEVSPSTNTAHQFGIGFINNNPTTDGYLTSNANAPACYVNNKWYHKVARLAGNNAATLAIGFDGTTDTLFTGMANYPQSGWTVPTTSTVTSNVSPQLSYVNTSVSNFTDIPTALTINTIPSGINPLSSTTICQGDSVGLSSNFSHVSYTWLLNGNPIPGVGQNSSTIYASTSGNYQLIGSNGVCVDTSASVTVTVNPNPNATITPPGILCAGGNSTNLTSATPGGTWSGTGITNALAGTFNPNVSGTGTFQVTYTVTVNGCTSTDNETITVNTLPNANFTFPSVLCDNSALANLNPVVNGGAFSGNGVTGSQFNPSTSGTGSIPVTYTITQNGCTNSSTNNIQVNPSPVIAFGSLPTFCQGGQAAILPVTPAGGTWSGIGITNTSTGLFNPSVSGVGTFNAIYSVSNNFNCTKIDTIPVVVSALPNAAFTSPASVCNNAALVQFTPTTPGGTWTGPGVVNGTQGTFDPTQLSPGTYQITYTANNNGCTSTSTNSIVVNAAPNVQIASQNTVCDNSPIIQLSATPSGGTWAGSGIVSPSAGTFNPAVSGPGLILVTYTATLGQCSDTDTLDILVNPAPDPSFTVTSPLCVTDNPVNLTPVTPGGVFSGTGGVINNTFDPAAGGGNYNVYYTVTVNGCTDSDTMQVVVNDIPVANGTVTLQQVGQLTYNFNGSASQYGVTYNWNFGDGNTGNGVTTSHTYANPGTYDVVLIVINACGSDTFTTKLVINGTSIASFENGASVNVTPNPFQSEIRVLFTLPTAGDYRIEIKDMLGRSLGNVPFMALTQGSHSLSLNQYFVNASSGTYFVHVLNRNNERSIHKVIKSN
jgi:PKD repeat protein